MSHHYKYSEVKLLISEDIPTLLTGEKGSGKTTLITQIADELKYKFYSVSMTRQTTLSSLIGFKNIKGKYVPTQLREAVEHGGLMLLDEIDAGDPNVLLCLNTLENGFMSFPDKIVQRHKDFRLCATSNPQAKQYTGRAVLDAATMDRFDVVDLLTDQDLETQLVGPLIADKIKDVREILVKWNMEKSISMRDSLRLKRRQELNITEGFIEKLLDNNDELVSEYNSIREKKTYIDQSECDTVDQLFLNIQKSQGIFNNEQFS